MPCGSFPRNGWRSHFFAERRASARFEAVDYQPGVPPRVRLLFRRGVPPQSSYIFKHALVQDAAYSTLLRSRRQRLHAHIAATLEGRFPEIVLAQPALLARHCELAGLTEKAGTYWLKAGQQAMARSAMTE